MDEAPEITAVFGTANEMYFIADGVPLRARFTPDEMRAIGVSFIEMADTADAKAAGAASAVLAKVGRLFN